MKVFVGGMSRHTTEARLHRRFSRFGVLESVEVVREGQHGRSLGFGFVVFVRASDARRAVDATDGAAIDGREVTVSTGKRIVTTTVEF